VHHADRKKEHERITVKFMVQKQDGKLQTG
jgi:hypothetical protein